MTIQKAVYDRHVASVAAGRVIFNEGEEGRMMYVIIEGEIEISKRTSDRASKTLTVLRKGDVFGEMSLIESLPRSATALAKTNATLLTIDENLFSTLARTNADFAFKMIKALSERVRKSNEIIGRLASENREARVLEGLGEFASQQGIPSVHGLRVSKMDFAVWGASHLGLRADEIGDALDSLIARKAIAAGAVGGEVLFPIHSR